MCAMPGSMVRGDRACFQAHGEGLELQPQVDAGANRKETCSVNLKFPHCVVKHACSLVWKREAEEKRNEFECILIGITGIWHGVICFRLPALQWGSNTFTHLPLFAMPKEKTATGFFSPLLGPH